MILQYAPEQKLAKQLMQRLRCRKDGVLADSMQAKEKQQIPAWGVSIMHIRDIARPFFGDQALGFELLRQDMREARLAAAFILDGRKLHEEQIPEIQAYLVTTEMMEQFSMRVFPMIPQADNFFLKILQQEDVSSLCVRAALLSLGRIWRTTDNLTQVEAQDSLALLLNLSAHIVYDMEDQLSFAMNGLFMHFPDLAKGLPMEMYAKIKKLTLLNYGSI